jgi:hypothetical protein
MSSRIRLSADRRRCLCGSCLSGSLSGPGTPSTTHSIADHHRQRSLRPSLAVGRASAGIRSASHNCYEHARENVRRA